MSAPVILVTGTDDMFGEVVGASGIGEARRLLAHG